MELNKIYQGDAESILKEFDDNLFDSYVTDPPYGLKFMGKHWDYDVPAVSVFKEMYRTLKPGGYILVACGTRTQHRMAVNIEDAGFEIRDNISYFYDGNHEIDSFLNSLGEEQKRSFTKILNEADPAIINWLYGSGFPKSLDVSKAIDKQAGAERKVIGEYKMPDGKHRNFKDHKVERNVLNSIVGSSGLNNRDLTEPTTDAAKTWEGWGTALKPAQEFWTLARKPLSEETVAENVLKNGTGGINIDAARITVNDDSYIKNSNRDNVKSHWGNSDGLANISASPLGRFPANVIFDEQMGKELDKQTGILTSGGGNKGNSIDGVGIFGSGRKYDSIDYFSNVGGASRFFYCAKADVFQRNKGLKGFETEQTTGGGGGVGDYIDDVNSASGKYGSEKAPNKNSHPTVKPIELMRYLVKLITPKGGTVCDPYGGSGTTGIAAKLELKNYVLIEREKDYCAIAEARIANWNPDKYKPQTLFA